VFLVNFYPILKSAGFSNLLIRMCLTQKKNNPIEKDGPCIKAPHKSIAKQLNLEV